MCHLLTGIVQFGVKGCTRFLVSCSKALFSDTECFRVRIQPVDATH
jgi:hypothetical protein